jgi:hypothetical protein
MKRALLIIGFLALPAGAQEATINSPIARSSIAKYKIDLFYFQRGTTSLLIDVVSQDSSNVDISTTRFSVPSVAGSPCTSATSISGLAGAMNTTRSGETGSNQRIQQFRQLGYLSDQGCLGTVTLVP